MFEQPVFAVPGATTAPGGNSYDDVPYESHPFAQTHPSRLATVATLFGLDPTPVERCRVLELGCSTGGNLIPMAEAFPDSTFVGIDLSGRQIAEGQRVAGALGLPNLTLRHASITDVDESYGEFDYVICHGVYSIVPDSIREAIFDTCARRLTRHGVVYVSYNTYPGWHMRGMIRDMMRFHALRYPTPPQRIQQARALLDFLAGSVGENAGAYATLLRGELAMLRNCTDEYVYHEHLTDRNGPVYFHQFAEQAWERGLRYLGEARVPTMLVAAFSPEVQQALGVVASNQIHAEQYMDFVRNRTFRETLLVRKEAAVDWSINPGAVRKLHAAVPARVADDGVDIRANVTARYQSPSGAILTTDNAVLKAALRVLSGRWPNTLPFDELDREVTALLGGWTDGGQALALGLLNTYLGSDLIDLRAAPLAAAAAPGERPVARRSARVALEVGKKVVTTVRHDPYPANDFERRLIPLLDGTRDRAALADAVVALILAGELNVRREGEPITDPAAVRETIGPFIDQALARLAAVGLLTA